jgi:polyisoprenoid-binding protein YceI
MIRKRQFSILLTALVLSPLAGLSRATAPTQQLLPAQSSLRFISRQMGVPVEGRFKRFYAVSRFDPKHPETSTVQLQIDLASVDIGNSDTEAELRKPGWFDYQRRPMAHFRSSKVRALGSSRFEVYGMLSIKGMEREVLVPMQLTQKAGVTFAQGSLALQRMDFRIGDGEWNDVSIVANEVQVHFHLAISGVPPI